MPPRPAYGNFRCEWIAIRHGSFVQPDFGKWRGNDDVEFLSWSQYGVRELPDYHLGKVGHPIPYLCDGYQRDLEELFDSAAIFVRLYCVRRSWFDGYTFPLT